MKCGDCADAGIAYPITATSVLCPMHSDVLYYDTTCAYTLREIEIRRTMLATKANVLQKLCEVRGAQC